MEHNFDVAVIGAGPAGSATALRLARKGCRVALIERTRFDKPRVGESLAPAVQPLLADLGVWEQFRQLQPLPSHGTRSIWGADTAELHSHIVSPWGCGWHIDRVRFDRLLASEAVQAGAELLCGTSLVSCREQKSGWAIDLHDACARGSSGRDFSLYARVAIDATGRGAHLSKRLGAERLQLDRLVGIAMVFRGMDTAQQGYVQVETTVDGWWYTAPIPHGHMIAIMMTDSDVCSWERLASAAEWRRLRKEARMTHERLGQSDACLGPRVFFASSHLLKRREFRRTWLAVGDAALAVDPVSGSGVIRALRSAESGVQTAMALLENGTGAPIESYENEHNLLWDSYLTERSLYYGMERRWPKALFWKRRIVESVAGAA